MKKLISLTTNFRQKTYGLRAALTVLSLTVISLTANAQSTYYWDPSISSGTTGGGAGTWENLIGDWYDTTSSSDVAWPNTGTDIASFGGSSGGTVTITDDADANGYINVGGLVFNTSDYTIASDGTTTLTINSGGITTAASVVSTTISAPITLGANQTWSVASGDTLTVSGGISGAVSLTKIGSGIVVLSSSNSYSGGTDLEAGTIEIKSVTSALGSGTLTLNGGTLQYAISSSGTAANNIVVNGTGSQIYSSSGNLYLTGIFSGSGSLTMGNNSTLTSLYITATNAITSGTIIFAGNNVDRVSASFGNANVAFAFNNTNSTYGSELSGSITLGSMTGNGHVSGGTITTGALGSNDLFSGTLTGGASLTKVGNGTMTLTAANTYTGVTTVSGGTLLVNGNQSAATGAVTVASGATLGGTGTIGGATTVNGGGTIFAGNAIGVSAGNVLHTGALTLASTSTYQLTLNSTTNVSDELVSTGAISLNGTLTVTDLDAGTPTGNLTILSGSSLSGTFSNYAQGALVDNGLYTIDYTGDSVMLIAVPEPSTIALTAIFGFGMLLLFRRRFGSNR